jgi:RimJ/RimL family protein N-acetyltransferase
MADAIPVITIQGELVALGPMRRDLIPLYHAWINNLETTQYLDVGGMVLTLDEEMAWFERLVKDQSSRALTIYHLPSYRPIGIVNLLHIDHRHHRAAMGIMIGEPAERGKGLGTEAVELILDYGFNALDLHSIWLVTYEFNHAGRAAYRKAGFQEAGRRRECRYHAGRYWDEIHMDILASEFTKSRLATRLIAHTERPNIP